MAKVILEDLNKEKIELDSVTDPKGKVPGYLITKEGYFINVPGKIGHQTFFKFILAYFKAIPYDAKMSQLEMMNLIINQLQMAIYIGREPIGENLYLGTNNIYEENFKAMNDFVNKAKSEEKFLIKTYLFPSELKLDENYVEEFVDFEALAKLVQKKDENSCKARKK